MKSPETSHRMRRYIYDQERKWFLRFEPFLFGRILKVGNGLGYFASFTEAGGYQPTVIDIQINEDAQNKDKVLVYDGKTFPFGDQSIDCVVCTLVLHHTPYPYNIIEEMRRVGKRIIVPEETYSGFLSKLDLVYRDIYVNTSAGQPSTVFWESYFRRGELERYFAEMGQKIIYHQEERKRSYFKELFVVEEI